MDAPRHWESCTATLVASRTKTSVVLLLYRYAAIAMASKLSDMQLGESMDIGPLLTKKEAKQTR